MGAVNVLMDRNYLSNLSLEHIYVYTHSHTCVDGAGSGQRNKREGAIAQGEADADAAQTSEDAEAAQISGNQLREAAARGEGPCGPTRAQATKGLGLTVLGGDSTGHWLIPRK